MSALVVGCSFCGAASGEECISPFSGDYMGPAMHVQRIEFAARLAPASSSPVPPHPTEGAT